MTIAAKFVFAGFILHSILQITVGQSGVDRHMVCKDVTGLFEDRGQEISPDPRTVQGRPGKIGPKGTKGDIGPAGVAGAPANVDYEQVREIIREEIQQSMNRLGGRIDRLEEQMNKTKETPTPDTVNCQEEYGGIVYNGSCLWAEDIPGRVDLATALATCNKRTASKLPEIYGEREYGQILGYLRNKIKKGESYSFAWTGMTRSHPAGEALLSNGNVAPYKKIRPAVSSASQWTSAEAKRTHVYLYAKMNQSDEGMGSIWPTFQFQATTLLCQKI